MGGTSKNLKEAIQRVKDAVTVEEAEDQLREYLIQKFGAEILESEDDERIETILRRLWKSI